MRVLVTAHDFELGGTQTYALTIAEQLQRLGHEATLYAPELGPAVEIARTRGLPLAEAEHDLPADVDVVMTQDAMTAYLMADRYPTTPQVYRCPSSIFDLQAAPQLPGVVSVLTAASDRFADRLRAMAVTGEVVRLRQPIDTDRFMPREAIRTTPRRALLLGNYLHGKRLDMLVEAWAESGVECVRSSGREDPEAVISDADIVVAKGKAALEGMACSRAVLVYDQHGCDGWVTPESYPAIEADNFAGQATDISPTPSSLRAILDEYDPAMGTANRDIVTRNHSAAKHAQHLVELMRGLAPNAPVPDAPLREMARLVRVQWATESRAHQQSKENSALHQRLIGAEDSLAATQEALENAVREADQRHIELTSSRRYRLAERLGGIADKLRGRS